MPFGAIWDHYCSIREVPTDGAWLADVKAYEDAVLSKR
jgi:L-rhamnose isomerase